MPVLLTSMFGLHQQPDVDRWQARMFESLAMLHVVRARSPREVVHVFGNVAVSRRSVARIGARLFPAGRTNDPPLRNRDADVVAPIVREELGVGVKLVRDPPIAFEYTDLREPVRDEVVVANRAGPAEGARHARSPRNAQRDFAPGCHRSRQSHVGQRTVVPIAVIRLNERQRRRQIDTDVAGVIGQPNRRDIDVRPVIRLRFVSPFFSQLVLAHPRRGGVPPAVPVQVQTQRIGRRLPDVAPTHNRGAGQCPRRVVEPDVDVVVGIPRR